VRRVFVPAESVMGDTLVLRQDEAHYLRRVLRVEPGDHFSAVLASGTERVATVESVGRDAVVASLGDLRGRAADPAADLRLYVGLTKGQKLDLVVQKCTELGASAIHPILCRRSIARPSVERSAGRTRRWRRIAEEAARQCGRTSAPPVGAPIGFADAVVAASEGGGTGVVLRPNAGGEPSPSLESLSLCSPVSVLVGPEGGLAPEEVEEALAQGLTPVSLGRRVLRAETAAIAATAILMHLLGEMG